MSTTTEKKSREQEMAERFARDTTNHELTVLKDEGLYRHVKARSTKPGEGWCCWFEVVTWPGRLVVTGDCGTFVFARETDMFAWFRMDAGRINPGYWAEKTPDAGASAKQYSEDVLREHLDTWLAEYEADYPEADADYEERLAAWLESSRDHYTPMPKEPSTPTPTKVRKVITEHEEYYGLAHKESARELLDELERADALSDSWEWDLNDWDWQFLWCCHAIVWAIAQYDTTKDRKAIHAVQDTLARVASSPPGPITLDGRPVDTLKPGGAL
jgi:hypothetical protein